MKRRMTLVPSDESFPSDVQLLPPAVDEQIDTPKGIQIRYLENSICQSNPFLFRLVETTLTQSNLSDKQQPEPESNEISEPAEESDVEEYSEEDDIPFDIESDESNRPMTYEQMEAMYKPKAGSTEPKVTFEDENIETSPSDEEEESNEYSEENEYDDDVSDVDDSDLLKRLEEKYGKLPPTNAQLDVDDDIEDEDDIDPTWTSN